MDVQLKLRIIGLSPLLMHNPAGSMKGADGGKISAGKKIPTPQEEAEASTYRDDKGQLVIPLAGFRQGIIGKGGSASGRKIGKMTAKASCAAGLFLVGETAPIVNPDTGKRVTEYKIHTCRAKVQDAGILRSRAMIEKWQCDIEFQLDDDFVSPDQAVQLLSIAGKMAGILDYRPQCSGTYGRYRVERI